MSKREQNRQFDEAVRRLEAELSSQANARRKLSYAERRRWHDEISKQGFGPLKRSWNGVGHCFRNSMRLTDEIEKLFRPLIGQRPWRASVGWGSFVTLDFGPKRKHNHHYHGDWYLWLYQCEWSLTVHGRCLANSESKKQVMRLAIDNLKEKELTKLSFDSQRMITKFVFKSFLELECKPYADATPDEDCWMLFMPNQQVAALRQAGLRYEPMDTASEALSVPR